MFVVTRFCVQPFARKRGVLVADMGQQFRGRDEAIAAGLRAERWAAGVVVFQVDRETASGLWREPRLISAQGETPRLPWRSAGPRLRGAQIVQFRPAGRG